MKIPCTRVDNMIPEHDPSWPLQHTRRREAVPQRWSLEIEAFGDILHRSGDVGVVENAVTSANDVGLVAVLVDRVGRLRGRSIVEHNLHDNVDPSIVLCADDKRVVVRSRAVGVEQKGRVKVAIFGIGGVAAEGPGVICAKATEFDDMRCVGGWVGRGSWEGLQFGSIERNDIGRNIEAGIGDIGF